jgi:hypothetical protein
MTMLDADDACCDQLPHGPVDRVDRTVQPEGAVGDLGVDDPLPARRRSAAPRQERAGIAETETVIGKRSVRHGEASPEGSA